LDSGANLHYFASFHFTFNYLPLALRERVGARDSPCGNNSKRLGKANQMVSLIRLMPLWRFPHPACSHPLPAGEGRANDDSPLHKHWTLGPRRPQCRYTLRSASATTSATSLTRTEPAPRSFRPSSNMVMQ